MPVVAGRLVTDAIKNLKQNHYYFFKIISISVIHIIIRTNINTYYMYYYYKYY